jgi:polysaccharide chain length determinant protein (PEP-CTERM system associated)
MLSRDMLVRVLKGLDLDVSAGSPEAFEALVKSCQDRTEISLRGNDLFFVSIVDTNPAFAKDFINALVNTYVEENLADKREESFGASRFISEQAAYYKNKLDAIENEINQFRKKTGIFSSVSEASLIQEIKDVEEELKGLRIKKNELLATIKTISAQLKMMKETASFGGNALFDMTASAGDGRIADLQAKIDELLLVYNEQYPTVIKLREQIAELEKRQQSEVIEAPSVIETFNPLEDPIFVDLKMRMNSTQSELNALQARENELVAQIENNKRILANFPEDKRVLADMEREQAMNRNVYESLMERAGISEVSKQMEVADKATTFRIVDPAILPTSPVGAKRLFNMLLGIALGIGAGLAAVFVREKLDDTVKDADAIRALGVAVLAEIPLMHNEEDALLARKWDRLVYSYAGICLTLIVVMLGHDLLGLTVLDQFIAYAKLDTLVSGAVGQVH